MEHVLTCYNISTHFRGRDTSSQLGLVQYILFNGGLSRGIKNNVKVKVWGVWTGTTSPSLTQHLYPINKGCSSYLGNLEGLQQSLKVLLWQKGNHKEEVDLRGQREWAVLY